jgi:hypothetical protein
VYPRLLDEYGLLMLLEYKGVVGHQSYSEDVIRAMVNCCNGDGLPTLTPPLVRSLALSAVDRRLGTYR